MGIRYVDYRPESVAVKPSPCAAAGFALSERARREERLRRGKGSLTASRRRRYMRV